VTASKTTVGSKETLQAHAMRGFAGQSCPIQMESTMTKAQLKEIRQIMACEYRMAIACKRTFTPIWYLFV
jgi:hypothetical protein